MIVPGVYNDAHDVVQRNLQACLPNETLNPTRTWPPDPSENVSAIRQPRWRIIVQRVTFLQLEQAPRWKKCSPGSKCHHKQPAREPMAVDVEEFAWNLVWMEVGKYK